MLTIEEIKTGDFVAYLGGHPGAEPEFGYVSSKNERFAFVRFLSSVIKFGFDGATGQSCRPEDLYRAAWWTRKPNRIGEYFVTFSDGRIGKRFFGPGDCLPGEGNGVSNCWIDGGKLDSSVMTHAVADIPKQH